MSEIVVPESQSLHCGAVPKHDSNHSLSGDCDKQCYSIHLYSHACA